MDIMQKNLQLSRDFASRPRRSVRLNAPVLSQQDEEEDWADEEAARASDERRRREYDVEFKPPAREPQESNAVLLVLVGAAIATSVAAIAVALSR